MIDRAFIQYPPRSSPLEGPRRLHGRRWTSGACGRGDTPVTFPAIRAEQRVSGEIMKAWIAGVAVTISLSVAAGGRIGLPAKGAKLSGSGPSVSLEKELAFFEERVRRAPGSFQARAQLASLYVKQA